MRIGMKKPGGQSTVQRAVNVLRRLTRSPAGIYTAGLGYLQTPANLLTWSRDFTNAAWVKTDITVTKDQINSSGQANGATLVTEGATLGAALQQIPSVTAASTHTHYRVIKRGNTDWVRIAFATNNALNGAATWVNLATGMLGTTSPIGSGASVSSSIVSVGNGFFMVALTVTVADADTAVISNIYCVAGDTSYARVAGATHIEESAGLSKGAYTASQLVAMGGIPWTMGTAGVALSLGDERVTNGEFDSASGWATTGTLSIANGAATLSTAADTQSISRHDLSGFIAGRSYRLEIKLNSKGGTANFMGGLTRDYVWHSGSPLTFSAADTKYVDFTAASSTGTYGIIFWQSGGGTATGDIERISVREILSTPCPVYTDAHAYTPGTSQVSYGPELVTNGGPFTDTSGWTQFNSATLSAVSGSLQITNTNYSGATFVTSAVVGRTYTVTVVRSGGTATSYKATILGTLTTLNAGSTTVTVVATGNQVTAFINSGTAGETLQISSYSVREVITSSISVNGLQTNNFTLSDGSSGYSAIDGASGLVLDGMGSLGSELVTNGDFSNGTTGYVVIGGVPLATAAVVGGELEFTANGGVAPGLRQGVATIAGRTYYAKVTARRGTSANTPSLTCGAVVTGTANTTPTLLEIYFVASGSTSNIECGISGSPSGTSYFDNLSVREVTGIHCSQSTTSAKPLLVRGLRNLLTWSSDFTNAAWAKGVVSIGAGGGLVPAAIDASEHNISQVGIAAAASTNYTVYAKVKKGTVDFCALSQYNQVSSGARRFFNLATGVLGSTDNFNGGLDAITPTIADAGNGYWLIALTQTGGAGTTSITVRLTSANADLGRIYSASDTASAQITVAAMGLTIGTLTAAQILAEGGIPITTSAAASNQSAGRYSSYFDGTNDSLQLGSVPFQMSDDSYVCVGTRIDAPSGSYVVSTGGGGVFPAIGDIGFDAAYHPLALWRDDSGPGGQAFIVHGASTQGSTVILETLKVGNAKSFYVNGVQSGATNNNLMGTATVTSTTIGSYGAGGSNHKGPISMVLIVKGTLSQADRIALARFVALATPNAPVF